MKHKERLKEMRANVHVLTLTATPIPAHLQLALSGVRELSLITTPPLDRLAVRTYISPFDPVIIREVAAARAFPRRPELLCRARASPISTRSPHFLRESVPEMKFRIAHGRMAPTELEDIMTGFYDRKFDVLLSTTIVESGLDIPTANTLIVHRADMFGLAQLYQLRGRVGRSKQRAYALFTTPANRTLTAAAEKRLKVLQSLDSLGAGFTLASHDLDIRGAGNLLGEEQSGHIKEVGYELYQTMLEEAVAKLRTGEETLEADGTWSPQINIGTSVLIPENLCAGSAGAARPLSPPRRSARAGRSRRLRRRTARPLRPPAGGSAASARCRVDQAPVPRGQCGERRCRAEGRGHRLPRRYFRQSRRHWSQWITGQGTLAKLRPDMKLVVMRTGKRPRSASRARGSSCRRW